jgi:hypothetical protein
MVRQVLDTTTASEEDNMKLDTYIFEPGDATRYTIVYGETAAGQHVACLQTTSVGGVYFTWGMDHLIDQSYMSEKIPSTGSCHEHNINALIAFLTHMGHDIAYRSEVSQFDDKGLYKGRQPTTLEVAA